MHVRGLADAAAALAAAGDDQHVKLLLISPAEALRHYQALSQAVTKAQEARHAPANAADHDGYDYSYAATDDLVRQALRLMGAFEEDDQSHLYQQLVDGSTPVAFPTALQQCMGWAYTYR